MKALHLFDIEQVDEVVSPEKLVQTTLDSPASEVFTDFKAHRPLTVEGTTPAADALEMMKQEHVKMKIVVSPNNDFLGVISTIELTERLIVSEVAKGVQRHEVLVSDLMVSRDNLRAFDYEQLQHAKVKEVIQALKDNGLRHCLVVDREHHHIRGVISSSDIARKLRLPVQIDAVISFKSIFEAVRGYRYAS